MKADREPFSFAELNAEPRLGIIEPSRLTASDGCEIAYYDYRTEGAPARALVFVHGGGACSCLGYQYLAATLSAKYGTRVYLVDMRGHGLSGGARGDSPTTERLWLDLSELIANVRRDCPDTPIYLGGHSSGGGLVLNYSSWAKREELEGYVFASPKLGYKSNADRHPLTDDPFAKARIGTILLNKISGGAINTHAIAVRMNYSPEAKAAEPLLVDAYTCSVVNAITPVNPERQFRAIDRPFYLFVGDRDELMLPDNTVRYFSFAGDAARRSSKAEIVTDQNHLGILRVAGDLIGAYFESAR